MRTLRSFIRIVAMAMLAILVAGGDLRSSETVELKGVVVDDSGKPVAGAAVLIEDDSLNPERWQRSDEQGRFALPLPSNHIHPWKSVYAISPEKERLADAKPKFKEGVLEIPELTLTLKKARIITGTVTDENGHPVEGALVGGCWQIPYPASITRSDQDGNFRFAYPEDGLTTLHQIFAIHKEFGMDFVETEEGCGYRSETPSEKIEDGPFPLKLVKWQTFKIRVVDEHQTPLPGIEVYAWLTRKDTDQDSINLGDLPRCLLQRVTDAQGIAEVPSISERTYFVAACPDGGILMPDGSRRSFASADKRWVDFDQSTAVPSLEMKKLGNVKGTVKRADGTPVAWSRITISRHDACGHGIQWTDAKGEFGIPWSEAGELFDIGVESELGAAPGVFAFDVGDGAEEKRLDFVLEKGVRLYGTVYNPDGTPSEDHQIFLHEKCPPSLLERMWTVLGTKADAETCPPGGCPEGVVIRQTSDYGDPGSGEKYEYLLPAVGRKYDIRVSSYTNPDVFFALKDYQVNGNEGDIKLDFHLKPR